MKYIRAKEAIIKYGEHKLGVKFTDNFIKERVADTIEELCDEFDWKWNEKEFPYSKARQHDRYGGCGFGDLKSIIREEENYGKYLNQDYEIYGAIWTDKGLIYVAKMNENGELELL